MRRFFVIICSAIIIIGGFYFFIMVGQRMQKKAVFINNSISTSTLSSNSQSSNLTNDIDNNNSPAWTPNIEITPKDCDNECKKFEKNDTELDYCEQVCGISDLYEQDYENAEGEVNEATCQKQTGIKKDYCLKDLAISEDDSKICAQIQDANIKKTCSNRFIEELLEGQNSTEIQDY